MRHLRPGRSLTAGTGAVVVALATMAVLSGCVVTTGRYAEQVFDEIVATRDVVYRTTTTSTGEPIDLHLDLYQPAGDTETRRPVIMWMHPGAFALGDKTNMTAFAEDSGRRGYVGVTIQYRLRANLAEIGLAALDAYDDSVAAVEWLKANAGRYGIDPDAIVAAGYSAGAFNALNLLYLPGTLGPPTSPVAGAIAISGSAFATPPPGRPPAVLFHTRDDALVPHLSAEERCDAANAVGNICHLVTYETGGHYGIIGHVEEILRLSMVFVRNRILPGLGYTGLG